MNGPLTPFSKSLHAEKYRAAGESFDESTNRIAAALTGGDRTRFLEFRRILREMSFMPAGRIQSAVGSTRNVTAYNCFVSGIIGDSFVEGDDSIMDRAKEAAITMRMGGGIGYDFSRLRPRGALIKKLGSKSSGPVSFMQIYNSVCQCIASSGHRRGAQMGVLRVDHPDIEEFIHVKHELGVLEGFNLSIGITDEFMVAVTQGTTFDLRWEGEVYSTIDARALWEMIMRGTWDWGEPGVLFLDTMNQENNLHYCEVLEATNPCGEQPLAPFAACLLGSFNLTRYIVMRDFENYSGPAFDWDQFRADIAPVVRAMDNVIDVSRVRLCQAAAAWSPDGDQARRSAQLAPDLHRTHRDDLPLRRQLLQRNRASLLQERGPDGADIRRTDAADGRGLRIRYLGHRAQGVQGRHRGRAPGRAAGGAGVHRLRRIEDLQRIPRHAVVGVQGDLHGRLEGWRQGLHHLQP